MCVKNRGRISGAGGCGFFCFFLFLLVRSEKGVGLVVGVGFGCVGGGRG